MTGTRKTLWGAVATVAVLAVSACSAQSRATSPKEIRRLAGSAQALQAREKTESRLRAVVRAYADDTPLTLGLLVVRDICLGGKGKQLFGSNGDDTYKIRCSMQITAYYGAEPARIVPVLDAVLTAGDRGGSGIPFTHDADGTVVDRYRDHVGDLEDTELSVPWHTLSWDPVRGHQPRRMVQQPDPCPTDDDLPVIRCLREPEDQTVAAIRKRYGMVFELDLTEPEYYKVSKKGQVYTN
ncbi:hypothetical protein R6V09_23435 [Streptomyces sp. W16]|uniref:hypothetical protein n=1 Tax=Streptomyces sp. W16 TaxID=3076631 RepID=UPI00295AB6A1|nr:hypothetical protein [Streptomyces sp. W16]MDV9173056.1 hypothetical protein [Streptomyces sp. W16]